MNVVGRQELLEAFQAGWEERAGESPTWDAKHAFEVWHSAAYPKGDDVIKTKCCGTPLRLHPSLYWFCDSCGREVKG